MEYYKVLCREGDKYYSAIAPGKYRIEYKKGEITEMIDDTIGVMVFESQSDCEVFIEELFITLQGDLVIKKVEAIGDPIEIENICVLIRERAFDVYYGKRKDDYDYDIRLQPPSGTKVFKQVRLI